MHRGVCASPPEEFDEIWGESSTRRIEDEALCAGHERSDRLEGTLRQIHAKPLFYNPFTIRQLTRGESLGGVIHAGDAESGVCEREGEVPRSTKEIGDELFPFPGRFSHPSGDSPSKLQVKGSVCLGEIPATLLDNDVSVSPVDVRVANDRFPPPLVSERDRELKGLAGGIHERA